MPYQRRKHMPNFDEFEGNLTIKPGRKNKNVT